MARRLGSKDKKKRKRRLISSAMILGASTSVGHEIGRHLHVRNIMNQGNIKEEIAKQADDLVQLRSRNKIEHTLDQYHRLGMNKYNIERLRNAIYSGQPKQVRRLLNNYTQNILLYKGDKYTKLFRRRSSRKGAVVGLGIGAAGLGINRLLRKNNKDGKKTI